MNTCSAEGIDGAGFRPPFCPNPRCLHHHERAGRPEVTRARLAELLARVDERCTCPCEGASAHVALGEVDEAIGWFERALEERADCWPWGLVDPRMEAVREDPRHVEQLRRVGLPLR